MELETMGRVIVAATVENVIELYAAEQGTIRDEDVGRVEVEEALVDTGATTLSLPGTMIEYLRLKPIGSRPVQAAAGPVTVRIFGPARLTIQGRQCTIDVTEWPDSCPVLIGQVPLELLDFVVDPRNRRLIGNPAHGGEHMYEMY